MCDEKIIENGKKIHDYFSNDLVSREKVLDCLTIKCKVGEEPTLEEYIARVSKRIKELPAVKK